MSGPILYVLPALEERKVIPDIAAWVAERAQPDDRVASFRLNRWTPTIASTSVATRPFWKGAEEAEAFFKRPAAVLLSHAQNRVR